MSKNLYAPFAALAVLLTLAGCGGGGDFDVGDTTKATESVEAKNADRVAQAEEWRPAYVESTAQTAVGQQASESTTPDLAAATGASDSLASAVALGVASGAAEAGAAAGAAGAAALSSFLPTDTKQ